MRKTQKLAQRQLYYANGHRIFVGLTGDLGYISIEDNNIYPDDHSGSERRNLGYNKIMIPLMTREQLKDLHTAIGEVLKNSK